MKYLKTYESYSKSIVEFLSDKPLTVDNTKLKGFFYHGTNVHPSKFEIDEDYCASEETGNDMAFECDLPDGVLFLTNSIKEAKAHGKYIIPCELKVDDLLKYDVDTDNPSYTFDDDFSGYGTLGMYSEFVNGEKIYDVLQVKGYNKSTFIAFLNVIVPRTDLAIEFYGE